MDISLYPVVDFMTGSAPSLTSNASAGLPKLESIVSEVGQLDGLGTAMAGWLADADRLMDDQDELDRLIEDLTGTLLQSQPGVPNLYQMETIDRLWKHSIGTASSARVIAGFSGVDPASAWFTGLVQDIGQIVLACRYPLAWNAIDEMRMRSGEWSANVELLVLGFDHAMLGGRLAEDWGLPFPICQAIRFHHHPERAQDGRLADIGHAANIFCRALADLESPDEPVSSLSPQSWSRLGLDWNQARACIAAARQAREIRAR